jgi:hypothetical protein
VKFSGKHSPGLHETMVSIPSTHPKIKGYENKFKNNTDDKHLKVNSGNNNNKNVKAARHW